jgi:predicted dehydrogenase
LVDALLWTTGRAAQEVCAIQNVLESGLDVVSAVALRLTDGTPATLSVSGVSPGPSFELNFFGDRGRIRATDQTLEASEGASNALKLIPLPSPQETIDANFVTALIHGSPLCCPAEEALDTVRLIEGIMRSALTRQFVLLQ